MSENTNQAGVEEIGHEVLYQLAQLILDHGGLESIGNGPGKYRLHGILLANPDKYLKVHDYNNKSQAQKQKLGLFVTRKSIRLQAAILRAHNARQAAILRAQNAGPEAVPVEEGIPHVAPMAQATPQAPTMNFYGPVNGASGTVSAPEGFAQLGNNAGTVDRSTHHPATTATQPRLDGADAMAAMAAHSHPTQQRIQEDSLHAETANPTDEPPKGEETVPTNLWGASNDSTKRGSGSAQRGSGLAPPVTTEQALAAARALAYSAVNAGAKVNNDDIRPMAILDKDHHEANNGIVLSGDPTLIYNATAISNSLIPSWNVDTMKGVVKKVSLSDCLVTVDGVRALMPFLQKVASTVESIDYTAVTSQLSDEDAAEVVQALCQPLYGAPHLFQLRFDRAALSTSYLSVARLLGSLPNLKDLSLMDCGLHGKMIQCISIGMSTSAPLLEKFVLIETTAGSDPDDHVALKACAENIGIMLNLKKLDLHDLRGGMNSDAWGLVINALVSITAKGGHNKLEALDLSGASLLKSEEDESGETVEMYTQPVFGLCYVLSCAPLLKHLNLDDVSLGSKGPERVIEALLNARVQLEALGLGGCGLGVEGAVSLGKFLSTQVELARISIPDNYVENEGIQAIVLGIQVKTLAYLNADGNDLGQDGAASIVQFLRRGVDQAKPHAHDQDDLRALEPRVRHLAIKDNFSDIEEDEVLLDLVRQMATLCPVVEQDLVDDPSPPPSPHGPSFNFVPSVSADDDDGNAASFSVPKKAVPSQAEQKDALAASTKDNDGSATSFSASKQAGLPSQAGQQGVLAASSTKDDDGKSTPFSVPKQAGVQPGVLPASTKDASAPNQKVNTGTSGTALPPTAEGIELVIRRGICAAGHSDEVIVTTKVQKALYYLPRFRALIDSGFSSDKSQKLYIKFENSNNAVVTAIVGPQRAGLPTMDSIHRMMPAILATIWVDTDNEARETMFAQGGSIAASITKAGAVAILQGLKNENKYESDDLQKNDRNALIKMVWAGMKKSLME